MKKKSVVIISIILAIFILVCGSLTGFPISSQLEESGCNASYTKYLFPRILCQLLTMGHCTTTSFNKHNAEVDIAHCLCEKYKLEPNDNLEDKILMKCDKLTYSDCDASIGRIKTDFCNDKGFNSLECNEYFSKNSKSKVDFICNNKEQIFYKGFIF